MKRIIVFSSLILTVMMFAAGHGVTLIVTVIGMAFNLPGPYSEEPIKWAWFILSLLILFGVSYLFCHQFALRIEKKILAKGIFE